MSQQLLTESPEKTTKRIARREVTAEAARLAHGESLSPLLQLQRTLGNQRVAQLIQAKRLTPQGKILNLQPKLTVGAADDQYEQEADRVARHVVSMPDSVALAALQPVPPAKEHAGHPHSLQSKPLPLAASITPFAQRAKHKAADKEEDQEQDKPNEVVQARRVSDPVFSPLQRQLGSEKKEDEPVQAKHLAGSSTEALQRQSATEEENPDHIQAKSATSLAGSFDAGEEVESRLSQSKGGGSPLPDPVRAYMEPRFGVDFSHVRVHTGSHAVQMNRAVAAQAFTHGADIYYGAGSSPTNLELTAHELTHVMQQTGGKPLPTKTQEQPIALSPQPPVQRTCAACAAGAVSCSTRADDKTAVVQRWVENETESGSYSSANVVAANLHHPSNASVALPQPSVSTTHARRSAAVNGNGSTGPDFTEEQRGAGANSIPIASEKSISNSGFSVTGGENATGGMNGNSVDVGGGIAAVDRVDAMDRIAPSASPGAQALTSGKITDPGAVASITVAGKIGTSGGDGHALAALDGKVRAGVVAPLDSGAVLAANLDGQNGNVSSAVAASSTSMLPQTPAVAQGAEKILQAVEIEKNAFSQDVQAQRTSILAESEGKAQAIVAKTTAKIQAITASIDSKKVEILSKFSESRLAIMAQKESRKATARADGDKALASLKKVMESKRKTALDAAEESASQMKTTGQAEAQRATNESSASASRVNTTAASESKKYGDTPKAKAAAAQAIQKVSTDLASKIRANGSEQAKQAQDTASRTAQGLRDSGKQLAASLGGNTAQVEQAIRQSVEGTVNRIDTVGKQQLESLGRLQAQALASLKTTKAQTIPAIQHAGKTAQTGARQTGQVLALQMGTLEITTLQQMTKGAHQVVSQLHQAEQAGRLNGKAVLEAARGVSEPLRQGRAQLTSLVMARVNVAQTQLGTLETTFGKEIDGAEQQLNGALGGVGTTTTSSLAQLQTELQQLFAQALSSNREAQQKAVSQYGDGLEQKINEAKQKWGQGQDKVQAGIRADIDKSLKTNQDGEQKATAEFAKVGKEAAEAAEESVLMGILKGVGKILLGLAALFVIAGLIFGAVAGLAFLGLCSAITFATALAIAAVGLLIVMFVLAVIQRTKEMDSVLPADRSFGLCLAAGFAVVFIALGDMVGITPIIEGITGKGAITQAPLNKEERAEKITEGVLTLLLIFIGGRVLKGLRKGDPAADPTVDPNKPVDPTVDPNKPTDPNVEPNKPDTPGDQNLGFEDGRRVTAEEPTADGKHKIKITEDGDSLFCSNCGRLTKEYAVELNDPKNADVLAELENADKISNPKLKAKRMAQIEAKLEQIRKDNPHPNDPKVARVARIQLLARDPAHGGKVTPGSLREAEVAVSLEEGGQVSGPVQRDPTGAADFIDGGGKPWDVKGFNSNVPKAQGGFDLATDAGKIDASLNLGENVMVDTGQISPPDVAALKAEGTKRGWGNRVKFFP